MTQEEKATTPSYLWYDPFRLHHMIISSCNSPKSVTDKNIDRFTTKYFCASIKDLLDRCTDLNIVPSNLANRRDIVSVYVGILRADYELMEKYVYWREPNDPPAPVRCPMTIVGAVDDVSVAEEDLRAWLSLCADTSDKCGVFLFEKGSSNYTHFEENETFLISNVLSKICSTVGDDKS